jgi:hypothetical protein
LPFTQFLKIYFEFMIDIPFNFVINCTDAELANYANIDVEKTSSVPISTYNDLCWCLQAYSILSKRTSLPVLCSNKLADDAINIVHSHQLLQLKGNVAKFIVCVQSDFPPRPMAHYHIVQNRNQLAANKSFLPLWIQPCLTKRHAERQGVLRVAYMGQTFNGNFAASEKVWQQYFDPFDIEFVVLSPESWHDLRTIDVLIALRSFDSNPHNSKPPSKLLNAWHAEIPFIGGYDSAYQQVGEPGEDYLVAQTPEQVVTNVLKLRDNQDLYLKLVENGKKKALQYCNEKIAEMWESVLTDQVLDRYIQWKARPLYERFRFVTMLKLALAQHQTKFLIKKVISSS